jgi:hypothetical protein
MVERHQNPSSMCGPTVMVGFSSYRLITSEVTTEIGGCRTFIIYFLNGSFFNNSDKGTRIFIFLNSCSRMKEACGCQLPLLQGQWFIWGRLVSFSQCTLAWIWLGRNFWFFVLIRGGGFGSPCSRPQIILLLGIGLE